MPEMVHGFSGLKFDQPTIAVTRSGQRRDPKTYAGGRLPVGSERIHVPEGLTLLLDDEDPTPYSWIYVEGEIAFSPQRSSLLCVGTVAIESMGALTMGTEQTPIPTGHTACIRFVAPEFDPRWDPNRVSVGLLSNGSIQVCGQPVTGSVKAAGAPAGATQMTLLESPVNWRKGDLILIPGVNPLAPEEEFRQIQAIAGRILTLDKPLQFDHSTPRSSLWIHIGNMSRSCVFETDPANTEDLHKRGHIKSTTHNVHICHAGFWDLGRTDKSRATDDHIVQGGTLIANTGVPDNPRGVYDGVHLHHAGPDRDMGPAIVTGCVGSSTPGKRFGPGWCWVNHASHVIFDDCIAYGHTGASFVSEAGPECGVMRRGLSVRNDGRPQENLNFFTDHFGPAENEIILRSDFGVNGNGVWLQGGAVYLEDMAVYGAHEAAIVSWARPLGPALESYKDLIPRRNVPREDPKSTDQTALSDVAFSILGTTIVGCGSGIHALDNLSRDIPRTRAQYSEALETTYWNNLSVVHDFRYASCIRVSGTFLGGKYGRSARFMFGDTGGPTFLEIQKSEIIGFDRIELWKGPWSLNQVSLDDIGTLFLSAGPQTHSGLFQDVTFGDKLGAIVLQLESVFLAKPPPAVGSLELLWQQTGPGGFQRQLFAPEQDPNYVVRWIVDWWPDHDKLLNLSNAVMLSKFGQCVLGVVTPPGAHPASLPRMSTLQGDLRIAAQPVPHPFLAIMPPAPFADRKRALVTADTPTVSHLRQRHGRSAPPERDRP
jgi:hypothetical protein